MVCELFVWQVGVAYLLAFESANKLIVSPTENIEYDRLIENEYLGLKNDILDQSAILLSSYGCLTCMNCKTKEHRLVRCPELNGNRENEAGKQFKILLAFSGLKQALITNPGYNLHKGHNHGLFYLNSSFLEFPIPNGITFIAEIGFAGELRMVPQVEKRINTLAKLGYKKCIVPEVALKSLSDPRPGGMEIVGCKNLKEMINTVFNE